MALDFTAPDWASFTSATKLYWLKWPEARSVAVGYRAALNTPVGWNTLFEQHNALVALRNEINEIPLAVFATANATYPGIPATAAGHNDSMSALTAVLQYVKNEIPDHAISSRDADGTIHYESFSPGNAKIVALKGLLDTFIASIVVAG